MALRQLHRHPTVIKAMTDSNELFVHWRGRHADYPVQAGTYAALAALL